MVSDRKNLNSAFCVFALVIARIIPAAETSFQAESKQAYYKHAALFVFGDSVFDVGNNNFLNVSRSFKANFPPYGETFFRFPTGRFSDGRLIPDFIAGYANLPYWKPYFAGNQNFTNGANFASGGASVLTGTTPALDLETQLSFFKEVAGLLRQELGDAEAKKVLKNAVYFSSLGGVDYFSLGNTNSTLSQKLEYVNLVIGNLTDAVKEIYKTGGRKFAFQNVAPMGCSPGTKLLYNLSKNECLRALEDIVMLHNEILLTAAAELESQLSGYKYLVFDYFTAVKDRILDPSKYGFKEADVACCGSGIYRGQEQDCGLDHSYELCSNPSEYLYFDGSHITEHANSQIAELLWNGGKNVTAPYNMRQLLELRVYEIKNFSEYDAASADK